MEKKKERKKMNKNEILKFGFFEFDKVGGTYRADVALEQQKDVVFKLFALLYFVFWDLLVYLTCMYGRPV